ncbi:MAG: glycosyltransferase [Pseudomonadales bacterium]|nr:glycosyltransferase [Pseudomonadales bacterium]MBO6596007.1 glycosyltransferase [Pseudomonadales bacterium]MBO6822490.1 glycosyltransferase [Pseudomonadales bacterium]
MKVAVQNLSFALSKLISQVVVVGVAETEQNTLPSTSIAWPGVSVHTTKLLGPRRFSYSPALASALRSESPDIIHLHGLWRYTSVAANSWSSQSYKPLAISTHGMLAPSALTFNKLHKRIVSLLFQQRVLDEAQCLFASSARELEDIRNYGLKNPVAVIPHGVQKLSENTLTIPKEKVVLYMGRLHPIKGIETLISSWTKLENSFPDWQLQIVGPDSQGYRNKLERQIEAARLRSVKIKSQVGERERNRMMAAAEFTVLPSQSENFGLVVAESLMASTPVIANSGAPWEGLLAHNCGLWINRGTDELTSALRKMMRLPDQDRHSMGERGRDWMLDEFTWDSIAQKHELAYKWLLGDSNRPEFIALN